MGIFIFAKFFQSKILDQGNTSREPKYTGGEIMKKGFMFALTLLLAATMFTACRRGNGAVTTETTKATTKATTEATTIPTVLPDVPNTTTHNTTAATENTTHAATEHTGTTAESNHTDGTVEETSQARARRPY